MVKLSKNQTYLSLFFLCWRWNRCSLIFWLSLCKKANSGKSKLLWIVQSTMRRIFSTVTPAINYYLLRSTLPNISDASVMTTFTHQTAQNIAMKWTGVTDIPFHIAKTCHRLLKMLSLKTSHNVVLQEVSL